MSKPLTIDTDIEEIIENFSYLDDWEDRYGYLIELGRALTPMPDDAKNDSNKVQGCVSQVWLTTKKEDGAHHFTGASDAHIVSGLVAIALTLFSGKSSQEILALNEQETFKTIGLEEHLTPQRANGLKSMVQRIKKLASE